VCAIINNGRSLSVIYSLSPFFSFLQAKGSFRTAIVVILVDVEDLLV
jgi:hypothetical protein